MGTTYITATDRDARRAVTYALKYTAADLALVATSAVAVFAILLAYLGRLETLRSEGPVTINVARPAATEPDVDLNTVESPEPLQLAMSSVFENVDDRRFAAAQLFRFINEYRNSGRSLPNVGAIAHATLDRDAIARAKGLDEFKQRLDAAERQEHRASAAGAPRPKLLPLFTAADLAALKPHVSVRTLDKFRRSVFGFGCLYILGFHLVAWIWRFRRIETDRLLLVVAHLLTAIGLAAVLSRPDPLRDTLLFERFIDGVILGLMVMTAISLVDFGKAAFVELSYVPLVGALLLSISLILFGKGPGTSTAKVNLGPWQPIEAIRLLLALFLAGYFARRWEFLRELRTKVVREIRVPGWINLPRAEDALPVVIGVFLALLFFFLQKDLGPALFLFLVFLAVYTVARGRIGMASSGLVLLFLGFYLGYRLHISSTLVDRVRMWQSPWDNAVVGGDQVAHAVWAMAAGGWFGTGLGLADTRYLPAGHTDLVLPAIGEELGAVGLTLVAVLYGLLVWRAIRIGRAARNDYGFFLATALTVFLAVPVLIMASGTMGVTPLTGMVTPFLSYGGSAMVANFAALGMLAAIHRDGHPSDNFAPFRVPMRWLLGALSVCAVALVAVMFNDQVVRGDELVVKPHLGVQANGGRRFEYNPRVLDLVALMPRGTIYDRRGLPLATDDSQVVAGARDSYANLRVSLADACPKPDERCYPLGGRAFHLLGDARTRTNFSASNTSYIERDAESRLRGFDDRAVAIPTTDASGRSMTTIRRDFSQIVPALRHRHDSDRLVSAPPLSGSRDVHTTIDANLQAHVASIVKSYAERAAGRAAAVVIDPDSGELLASASFPWPTVSSPSLPSPSASSPSHGASTTAAMADPMLDRARYGLYPPGSTFKLVIASAALRQSVDLTKSTFMCVRLPDGRMGATISGWSRPVRDDVLDTHPHGAIDMHDGFVHSCNAYFAQLAVKIGSRPILDASERLGISLTPVAGALGRIRQTLPQIGYGQGDVVVTPLRMARAAGAVAANGVLRETRWELAGSMPSEEGESPDDLPGRMTDEGSERYLDPEAARVLGRYMRDVVLNGTGRSLRDHPGRIAGKTGTAELSGKPSHGWFVGFAPYGPAVKRIAFAVVIENAGYGAGSAAPAAGEIVTAAAQAGLVK